MAESKIVAAVGSAAAATGKDQSPISKQIEQAMAQAVTDALAEGIDINNSDEIKRRMLAARDSVMAQQKA